MSKDPTVTAVTLLLELREVISEGRGLLKDMTAERKAIEAVVNGLQGRVDVELARHIEFIRETVETLTTETSASIHASMNSLTSVVDENFGALADVMTGQQVGAHRNGEVALDMILETMIKRSLSDGSLGLDLSIQQPTSAPPPVPGKKNKNVKYDCGHNH